MTTLTIDELEQSTGRDLGASEWLDVSDKKLTINYGIDKVRFPAPVPVGSRIRAQVTVNSAERKPIGVLYNLGVTVEVEGQEKPALVGDVLFIAG